jgi:hypothetical protein
MPLQQVKHLKSAGQHAGSGGVSGLLPALQQIQQLLLRSSRSRSSRNSSQALPGKALQQKPLTVQQQQQALVSGPAEVSGPQQQRVLLVPAGGLVQVES